MATVLIIEDNLTTLTLCAQILQKDYKILTAKNSDEGLILFKEYKPDLVITGLMLPSSKGAFPTNTDPLAWIADLRASNTTSKIIIHSALCYEIKLQKMAITLGVDACLVPLVNCDILKQTVDSLLSSHPSTNV